MLRLNERRKILRSIFSFVLHVFYFFSSLCMFVSPRCSNVLGWPLSLTGTLWFKRFKSFDLREATAFLPLEASRFSSAQLIQSRFLRDVFAIGHFVFLLRTKKFKSDPAKESLPLLELLGRKLGLENFGFIEQTHAVSPLLWEWSPTLGEGINAQYKTSEQKENDVNGSYALGEPSVFFNSTVFESDN